MVRSEIGGYDALQVQLTDTTADGTAQTILDLGSGTGETAAAILKRHPMAKLTGIDSSEDMLSIARQRLPEATFQTSRLEDPLPSGPFDVIVSAFAVHHLDGRQKADLFRRIANTLTPDGIFSMLDVVTPTEPVDAANPLEEGVDKPSTVAEMLGWLTDSALDARVVRSEGDLAILTATPSA